MKSFLRSGKVPHKSMRGSYATHLIVFYNKVCDDDREQWSIDIHSYVRG